MKFLNWIKNDYVKMSAGDRLVFGWSSVLVLCILQRITEIIFF